MKKNQTLFDEIRTFQKQKFLIIPIIVLFGLLGLFLPIVPGITLLFFAFIILFPRKGEILIKKLRNFLELN